MSNTKAENLELVKQNIGDYPDFPIKGILFKDLFSALTKGEVCVALKELFLSHIRENCPDIDCVVGLDSRGFLFSFLIASELAISCVPVRKKGKLPGECISIEYSLEYGTNAFEMQKNSIKPGQKVLIVDDLLATGGSLDAAIKLITQVGGVVEECLVVMELTKIGGRQKLGNYKVHSFIQYDDVE